MSLMKKLVLICNTHEDLDMTQETPSNWNWGGAHRIAEFLKKHCDEEFIKSLAEKLKVKKKSEIKLFEVQGPEGQ